MAQKITLNTGTTFSIRGRIATFDDNSRVLKDGIIYIKGDTIVDVLEASEPAPDGFSKSRAISCGGTIYPGLIELHNHLSYNIIPLWNVPKRYSNRDQWRSHPDYRKFMTGPLRVLGHMDGYLQAIVRYVECRLLFAGVTSSQGITLAGQGGILKFYKGIVRNVEQTIDDDLPSADTRIADITDAEKLLEWLNKSTCYLLHLAEGTQESANKHFRALQLTRSGDYAVTDSLAGIHSVGLFPEDFKIMGEKGGSMIWSPMSNLLLYGVTAEIKSAKDNGVLIGLGSDWTPSGTKNLPGELKVAKLYSDQLGGVFTNEELCRMVTSNAAKILKWNNHLGSLEPGKKADLIVLTGKSGDVYENLIAAKEQTVSWSVIGGIPRCGQYRLMSKFNFHPEKVKLKTITRYIYLANPAENPIDLNITYTQAKKLLKDGMRNLPEYAKQYDDDSDSGIFAGAASADNSGSFWHIASEHEDEGHRHHIPLDGQDSAGEIFESAISLSELITQPQELDEATFIEDMHYFDKLALQNNLPEYIKTGLAAYYGKKINLNDSAKNQEILHDFAGSQFNYVVSLARFREMDGYLSMSDKLNIVEQAIAVLSEAYVHLSQKEALYAANPLLQLKVIRQELRDGEFSDAPELEFHQRLINVFNSLRDLHTMYQLPVPFKDKVAFLPFYIEQYHDGEQKRFIVSKVLGARKTPFEPGVEIYQWNGIPIEKAILNNGKRFAGSNNEARFARGLDSMTFRPLAVMLPPEEDFVYLQFIANGKKYTRKFDWMVGSVYNDIWEKIENEQATSKLSISGAYDYLTELVGKTKMYFFSPGTALSAVNQSDTRIVPKSGYFPTSFPNHFKAKKLEDTVGYIRIYSFNVDNPVDFAMEFKRLLVSMGSEKIIVDIRNNGGGHIWAAEFILQTLTTKDIQPQQAQFINSGLIESICRLHSPSSILNDLDLSPWYNTLKEIKNTGTDFSVAYPITPEDELKKFKSEKDYKVLLIVDALCYSASDIFVAGFQDEKIGKVLGIHKNTGAGGANVWTHSLLNQLTQNNAGISPDFKSLPFGADIRVAVRKTLRNRDHRGVPLEDLGIVPDKVYRMTKDDLLHENRDLLSFAKGYLSAFT